MCRPVCDDDTCAETAVCIGKQHQPKCHCPVGTKGNPFVDCSLEQTPVLQTPECSIDSDCASQLVCTNSHCTNPCAINSVCSPDQECRVLDSSPLRTIMCQCPSDAILDPSGRCIAIVSVQPQCRTDNECSNVEKCIKGNCVEACRLDRCGINALCKSLNHQSVCSCAPGYTGNAHYECTNIPKTPIEILPPECYNDNDCSYDKTCRNHICVNPCREYKVCAANAFCSINNHKATCRCPAGYDGNPHIECIARKYYFVLVFVGLVFTPIKIFAFYV